MYLPPKLVGEYHEVLQDTLKPIFDAIQEISRNRASMYEEIVSCTTDLMSGYIGTTFKTIDSFFWAVIQETVSKLMAYEKLLGVFQSSNMSI